MVFNTSCTGINSRTAYTLTKTTAAQKEIALSYYSVRGLYSLAVVSVASSYSRMFAEI